MFQPIVPDAGLTGWRFLQRTYDTQFAAFSSSIVLQRDTEYFRENIGQVTSAEDLVSDRRLLTVALGAFGLQDDLSNRFFIRKVLEEGTESDDALSIRLSDTRYREMSEAFGFGPAEFLKIGEPDFVEAIISRFQTNSFEVAAGVQADSMRVALYAQRQLSELAEMDSSTDTKWFTVLGDPPLRQMFEKALGLPTSIGQIDIDQQLDIFKDRARAVFDSDDLAIFSQEEMREDAISKYLLRNQIDSIGPGLSGNAIALTLISG